MKKYKRVAIALLAFALIFSSFNMPITVYAGTSYAGLKADMESNYNKLQTIMGKWIISAQPDSALILESQVNISEASLSSNYASGVIDLPRLSTRYYYEVHAVNDKPVSMLNEYGFSVSRTFYPSLSWDKDVPKDTKVELVIRSEDDSTNIIHASDLTFTEQLSKVSGSFKDVTDCLLSRLSTDANCYNFGEKVSYYPHQLHSSCIVMPGYIIAKHNDDNFVGYCNDLNQSKKSPAESFDVDYTFTHYEKPSQEVKVKVKDLVQPYQQNTQYPAFFALFEPVGTGMSYDSNRGVTSTGIILSENFAEGKRGRYIICLNDDYMLYDIANTENTDKKQYQVNTNQQKLISIENGEECNIEEEAGLGSMLFYDWAKYWQDKGNISISSYPTIKNVSTTKEDVNLFASSAAYTGITPSEATVALNKPDQNYTVTWNYTKPNDPKLIQFAEETFKVGGQAPPIKKGPTEYIQYYTFDNVWYTNQECTTQADMQKIASEATEGAIINLYGQYKYTGGEYHVQFYNDATGESKTETFECRNKPTLPATPTRTGYLFHNWKIVYNTAATSGTDYNPDTFRPSTGQTYLFKTFWDVAGIVTDVTNLQNEYYVGDAIDKTKVVVTVQTDNNSSTTKTLNVDEFSVSPEKTTQQGTQQILVTYLATGATGTFNVNVKPVQEIAITARYNGSNLAVGSQINKSNVTCTVNYNNGSSQNVTDFTLAPTTISNAGNNTIRVIHGTLSTTITVVGNKTSTGTTTGGGTKPTGGGTTTGGGTGTGTGGGTGSTGNKTGNTTGGNGSNSSKSKKLNGISAYYQGSQPYVGDIIKASDISVTASYSDGTTTNLSSTAFQFSPSYIRNSGSNTITVSYGGSTTTVTVSAIEKSSTSTDSAESSKPTKPNGISGVDDDGNPISSNGATSTGKVTTGTNSSTGTVLGNPLTGAGMSASNKGTSVGYMNGSNILTSRLYGGATSIENSVDILSEIKSAGESASSVDITLYNGAANNDITSEMLGILKEKDLTLNISMMSAEDKSTKLGYWTIVGSSLTDTNKPFSPNISFEVTDKGAEVLTYMAVTDGSYPDNTQLKVYPALSTYDSGELIRMYSCGFDKTNAHLEKSFAWSDVGNELTFDVTKSKRYCLSNSMNPYEEGADMKLDNSLPSELDALESETVESTEITSEVTESEEFDWGDESTETQPEKPEKKSGGFPLVAVLCGIGALGALGVGTFVVIKFTRGSSGVQRYSEDTEVEDIDDDEVISEESDEDEDALEDDEGVESEDDYEDSDEEFDSETDNEDEES